MRIDWRSISLFLLVICLWQAVFIWLLPRSSLRSYNQLTDKTSVFPVPRPIPPFISFNRKPNIIFSNPTIRIAILLPYIGDHLPLWFDTWAFTAASTYHLIDWYIFVTEIPRRATPSNVKLTYISKSELYERVARIDDSGKIDFLGRLGMNISSAVKLLVEAQPYILVELKPCLGFIFKDYITGYTHWGYADLDTLIGQVPYLVNQEILSKYDIITFAFGDNFRFYMRGQLTIHKNSMHINNLWRRCNHLSRFSSRLHRVISRHLKEQQPITLRTWGFQSAEGCYSRVVADDRNVSVYVSASQMSDAYAAPLSEKETIFLGRQALRCFQGPLWHPSLVESILGGRVVVRDLLEDDPAALVREMFLLGGPRVPGELYELPGTKCREGSILHFQGWKRVYHSFATQPPPPDTHAFLVTESGFIPLRLPQKLMLPDYETIGTSLGVDVPVPVRLRRHRNEVHGDLGRVSFGVQSLADSNRGWATNYCAAFGSDLTSCICPVLTTDVTVLQESTWEPPLAQSTSGVTLLLADWAYEEVFGNIRASLDSWDGPAVLVLATYESENSSDGLEALMRTIRVTVDVVLVHLPACYPLSARPVLPDNMLLNIALDVSCTEVICISSSGMVFAQAANRQLTQDIRVMLSSGNSSALVIPISTQPSESAKVRRETLGRCGMQQSTILLDAGEDKERNNYSLPLRPLETSHFEDFLGRYTLLQPLVFNRTKCIHGSTFVRLPEELNGVGCFGSAAVAVLLGSGYTLHWARTTVRRLWPSPSITAAAEVEVGRVTTDKVVRWANCGCTSVSSSGGRKESQEQRGKAPIEMLLRSFIRYYNRATTFRQTGIPGVHSKEPFSTRFDKEQFELGLYKS